MARVTDANRSTQFIFQINRNKELMDKYGNEISTGVKVAAPSDSNLAATVARTEEGLARTSSHLDRIKDAQGLLEFQEATMNSASEVLIRAKELAIQGANETLDAATRALMADEAYALLDEFASLANGQYLGKYVYGAADDDDPPFDHNAAFYANPGGGARESGSYQHDGELGTSLTRSVQITDSLQVTVNSDGGALFTNGLIALERLARSLAGYETLPAVPGVPDGTGAAYVFPADASRQTQDIKDALDLVDAARQTDIVPEKTSLAGRLKRLQTAEGLLEQTKLSLTTVLSRIRDADFTESATNLTQVQQTLEASMSVSARLLNLSLLDFI